MKKKFTVAMIIGTRPEVIKLYPLIEIHRNYNVRLNIISTSQQTRLLKLSLKEFGIREKQIIKLSTRNQITTVFGQLVIRIGHILEGMKPNLVIVQGDTTSAVAGAAAAFYKGIPVAHVEAGLRSGNLEKPFPEEMNRQVISRYSKLHFVPTKLARENLLEEGIKNKNIFLVGNTIVDTLRIQTSGETFKANTNCENTLLVTLHRRENFKVGIKTVCRALNSFAEKNKNVKVLFVQHSNPQTAKTARKALNTSKNIRIIRQLTHSEIIKLMVNAKCILTDSGGIQEEAYLLNKKVLIARTETERPEVLKGDAKLLDLKEDAILRDLELAFSTNVKKKTKILLTREILNLNSDLGDGYASERIMEEIRRYLESTLD